ncbi:MULTISPECIES: hypothetical protein [Corynebacterium]|uniref:hypothetical protein n=1 Tax=Corynebacterium TaxID=1716 RepID=UPI00146927D9|nr:MULTISPECIES: hypothetical protein [Corynebacterium]GFK19401.1 hypothetical protein KbCgl_19730 [Corynebacterium glutamicum]
MILTLNAKWKIDPCGPLRREDQAEDLWSLINSIGSIMSGTALSPWFVGESNEEQLRNDGELDDLVLEIYSADSLGSSVIAFLPAIMLATEIGLHKAYSWFDLTKVSVDLHPGERPFNVSSPWWNNYFNYSHKDPQYMLAVSPQAPDLARTAQLTCPNLFSSDGNNLLSRSWGLIECAVIISLLSTEKPEWDSLSIEALRCRSVSVLEARDGKEP